MLTTVQLVYDSRYFQVKHEQYLLVLSIRHFRVPHIRLSQAVNDGLMVDKGQLVSKCKVMVEML